jgi:hypothetical protein
MIEINNTNFATLKAGDKFVGIENGEAKYYEFLMIHPHNDSYILALDNVVQEGKKIYIPTLIGGGFFFDYTIDEVNQKKIEQLEAKILRIKKRIKLLEKES